MWATLALAMGHSIAEGRDWVRATAAERRQLIAEANARGGHPSPDAADLYGMVTQEPTVYQHHLLYASVGVATKLAQALTAQERGRLAGCSRHFTELEKLQASE